MMIKLKNLLVILLCLCTLPACSLITANKEPLTLPDNFLGYWEPGSSYPQTIHIYPDGKIETLVDSTKEIVSIDEYKVLRVIDNKHAYIMTHEIYSFDGKSGSMGYIYLMIEKSDILENTDILWFHHMYPGHSEEWETVSLKEHKKRVTDYVGPDNWAMKLTFYKDRPKATSPTHPLP